MKMVYLVIATLTLFLLTSASVQAAVFDYSTAGAVVVVDGITSTATASGGALKTSHPGYGVIGNDTDEINYNEILTITFSQNVLLNSITFNNSDGNNNDLVEMKVDGSSYNFGPAFGNNHPEEMTSRATGNTGTQIWTLDFTGLNVSGTAFAFLIPGGSQALGNGGSEYILGGMNVSAVPEPATLLLLGSGLVGLVGLRRKFRK